MQIVIVDDNLAMREMLSDNVKRVAEEKKIDGITISFAGSAAELLGDAKVYDVYFLDVELDTMNGIELAKRLRHQGIDSPIVFVSSFDKYVWDSFPVGPYAYVRKEHLMQELDKILPKLLKRCSEEEERAVVTMDAGEVTFQPSKVIYFYSVEHYIKIVEHNGSIEPLMLKGKIKNIEEQVVAYDFIRTHDRYLVNMNHVVKVRAKALTLSNGEEVPVSRKYKNSVQVAIHRYIRNKR